MNDRLIFKINTLFENEYLVNDHKGKISLLELLDVPFIQTCCMHLMRSIITNWVPQ